MLNARLTVLATYVVAALGGWAVVSLLDDQHPITAFFAADLVATFIVFIVSVIFFNASFYDPYWSVAPPLILGGWIALAGDWNARQVILFVLVLAWAVRLTGNWLYGWRGLKHEDWRYVQIREQTRGRLPWWLVNLTGIQLMPTLVVFLGLIAAWPAVVGDRPFNVLDIAAIVVTVIAIALETIADLQLHRFARDEANRGSTVNIGLWRYSRHPNYLGEISFWWGLWLFGLAAAPDWWWTVIGPLAMVALFVGVSIPLMERRSLERRPDYGDYQRRVSALLPMPRK